MTQKKLYKGVFSYNCGIEREYTFASSPAHAKVLLLRRIAKKHDVSYQTVFGMFNGSKQNFIIEEEKDKLKEAQNESLHP